MLSRAPAKRAHSAVQASRSPVRMYREPPTPHASKRLDTSGPLDGWVRKKQRNS
jgi:hypothetical protein